MFKFGDHVLLATDPKEFYSESPGVIIGASAFGKGEEAGDEPKEDREVHIVYQVKLYYRNPIDQKIIEGLTIDGLYENDLTPLN